MIPPLLILTPNDSRPIDHLIEWLRHLGCSGVQGIIYREFNRPAVDNHRALDIALQQFRFVSVHHRSLVPPHARAAAPALHLPIGANPGTPQPFGCSCHSAAELDHAFQAGASYALLSPVYRPTSKPTDTRQPLGLAAFMNLAQHRPVLALGGVTAARYARLRASGAYGAAVLGDFASITTPHEAMTKVDHYESSLANVNNSES